MYKKVSTIILNIFNILILISAIVGLIFGIIKYLMLIL